MSAAAVAWGASGRSSAGLADCWAKAQKAPETAKPAASAEIRCERVNLMPCMRVNHAVGGGPALRYLSAWEMERYGSSQILRIWEECGGRIRLAGSAKVVRPCACNRYFAGDRFPASVRSISTTLATLRMKMLGSFNPH